MSYVDHRKGIVGDECDCRVPRPDTHGLGYCTNIDCFRRIVALKCSECQCETPSVRIDATNYRRYCEDCWRKRETAEKGEKLEKCMGCKSLCTINAGSFLQGEFFCEGCLSGGGEVHLKIKAKGNARAIAFWHYLCWTVDKDWPFLLPEKERKVCGKCGGLVYMNPLLKVEEVRKLGEELKVGKIKIKYWGEASKCEGTA
jgi:hypothetical protein